MQCDNLHSETETVLHYVFVSIASFCALNA